MTWSVAELLHDTDGLLAADGGRLLPAAATAGAQVRAIADQLTLLPDLERPRALVIAGSGVGAEAAMLRALAGPQLAAPIVAVDCIPSWVGSLDTVVVLADQVHDMTAAAAADTAVRRGATVIVRSAETGPVAAAGGSGAVVLPAPIAVPEAIAGQARLALLVSLAHRSRLLPAPDLAAWADALDAVALACHPSAEEFVNPAVTLAEYLVGGSALLIGADSIGDVLAELVAQSLAQLAGRPAGVLTAQAALSSPAVLRRAAAAKDDLFADPLDDAPPDTAGVFITLEPDGQVVRALTEALPSAPVVAPASKRPGSSVVAAAEVLLRCTFTAVYLGIAAGQFAPLDNPDGLGRTGTALGEVRVDEGGTFVPRDPDQQELALRNADDGVAPSLLELQEPGPDGTDHRAGPGAA
jgi:hypothetical protein